MPLPNRRSVIITLLILFTLSNINISNAQIMPLIDDSIWASRVKLLTQFFNRFNFDEDIEGNQVQDSTNILEHRKAVASLFERNYVYSSGRDKLLKFVNQVTRLPYPVKLSLRDQHWYAEATCSATYNDQPVTVSFTLGIQKNPDNSVEWVMVGGFADFLPKTEIRKDNYLAANAHELNFMRLGIGLKDKEKAFAYTGDNYEPDYLAMLLMLVQLGNLEINAVQNLEFHFLQIDGWRFSVKEFNRKEHNSGWLMYEIEEIDDEKKNLFIKKKLYVMDQTYYL